MVKSIKTSRLAWPLIIVVVAGCNSSNDQHSYEESVLKSPIFTSINDSIRQFPTDADLYSRRAKMLSQNNANDVAYDDYKKSWELNPSKENGLLFAGNLSVIGKFTERLELLKSCEKKYPNSLEFKRLMGEAYVENGKPSVALDLYNKMLEQDSTDFETWFEKGLLLEQMRDTARALTALKNAYDLQPVNTYALELAHLYAESSNPLALEIC